MGFPHSDSPHPNLFPEFASELYLPDQAVEIQNQMAVAEVQRWSALVYLRYCYNRHEELVTFWNSTVILKFQELVK
ncbi:hypothetical protein [Scytonema sp. PCC 10023]|uniref:hypothetical protein n=1 Tax=Scytonema sp. PCC 10023 TaxID=1680591 RepID=UPI0039C70982